MYLFSALVFLEKRERVCCFLGKYFPSIWLGWVGGSVARCISYRFGMSFSLHYLCRLLFIVVVFLIVFCFSYYYNHFLCKTELELPTTQSNGFVYSRVIDVVAVVVVAVVVVVIVIVIVVMIWIFSQCNYFSLVVMFTKTWTIIKLFGLLLMMMMSEGDGCDDDVDDDRNILLI